MSEAPVSIGDAKPVRVGLVSCTNPSVKLSTTDIWDSWRSSLIVSKDHYRLRNGAWSGGGPFYVHHRSQKNHDMLELLETSYGHTYKYLMGGVGWYNQATWSTVPKQPPDWEDVYIDLQGYYPTGRARTLPGAPVANIGQFLVELRDLPQTPGRGFLYNKGDIFRGFSKLSDIPKRALHHVKNFRNLGSEYLNVLFGWKPFVSDLRKMYNLQRNADAALTRLISENGKGIRRRAILEEDTNTTEYTRAYTQPYAGLLSSKPFWYPGKSFVRVQRTVETKVWYAARYQYFIPEVNLQSSQWTKRAKAALFGVYPTPELLWEVLPWSWLIDWYTNFGDVATNLSYHPAENLISNYSFVMKHVKEKTVATCHVSHPPQSSQFITVEGHDHTFRSVYKSETKARAGGVNPFGLNVKWSDLSPYQISIVAALGLSRSSFAK